MAMYEAKETGRDRSALYAGGGRARMEVRLGWAERIRRALDEDGFTVHAQPILDLSAGAVTRYELLLRLADATGALRRPALFLPIAERFDLLRAIDLWITRRAISLLAGRGPGDALLLQVNLSGLTVGDEGFVELIERECAAAGVAPADLTFEITETADHQPRRRAPLRERSARPRLRRGPRRLRPRLQLRLLPAPPSDRPRQDRRRVHQRPGANPPTSSWSAPWWRWRTVSGCGCSRSS